MPSGAARDWHLNRTAELEEILGGAALEDFVVENDDRTPRDVALEVLGRARWV